MPRLVGGCRETQHTVLQLHMYISVRAYKTCMYMCACVPAAEMCSGIFVIVYNIFVKIIVSGFLSRNCYSSKRDTIVKRSRMVQISAP